MVFLCINLTCSLYIGEYLHFRYTPETFGEIRIMWLSPGNKNALFHCCSASGMIGIATDGKIEDGVTSSSEIMLR